LKWNNHKAIARAIASSLELNKNEERLLVEGSIDPDRYPDLEGKRLDGKRRPHHAPTTEIIMEYVWDARSYLMMGQRSLAMLNLGRALHYIQDRSVGFSSWADHDRKEIEMEQIEPDLRAIRKGIGRSHSSPLFIRKVANRVRPRRNTRKAMREACRASGAVSAAVLKLPRGSGSRSIRGVWTPRICIALALSPVPLGLYGYLVMGRPYLILLCPLSLLLLSVIIIRRRDRKDLVIWYGG
jgi:hypothetical protein